MKVGTYFQWAGIDRVELPDREAVGVYLPDGNWVELHYRKSDGELSLSCYGRLVILPVASNVVRVRVES